MMQDDIIVEVKDIDIYQNDSLILKNVHLSVKKGEFIYVVGKTGSGKSSILKTLYGEMPLKDNKGIAQVVGFDLHEMNWRTLPQLRRKLGIVFQDFRLLTDRTVYDNLQFVLRATGWKDEVKIKERIQETLQKVGMENKGFKMPFDISGGEQQKVDIARAILNTPQLILADEPTGNLDAETSLEIVTLLEDIAKSLGTAIIMATHDQFVIQQNSHSIVEVKDGEVISNILS